LTKRAFANHFEQIKVVHANLVLWLAIKQFAGSALLRHRRVSEPALDNFARQRESRKPTATAAMAPLITSNHAVRSS
jgi:hypothetical protein